MTRCARRLLLLLWVLGTGMAPSGFASAEDEPEEGDDAETERPVETLYDLTDSDVSAPDEARRWEVRPGTEPEDVALAAPRVLLTPPRGLAQLVFAPIQGLLFVAERHDVVAHVEKVLYWNDEHTAGLLPMVYYGSGMGWTAGADLFHGDVFGHGEELRSSARFGGRFNQGYQVRFRGDRIGGSRLWLDARARFEINPRLYYAGIGVADGEAQSTRYLQRRVLGVMRAGVTLGSSGRRVQAGVTGIVNRRDFGPAATDDLSIEEGYDTAQLPGFCGGANTLEVNGTLIVDTRRRYGLDSAGGYLELFGGGAVPIGGYAYGHYGLELRGTINLYRHTRLLTFRGAVEAVHGPTDRIPFTDLPRLGGADRMRGYEEDQFRDEKLVLASVEYYYPIHDNVLGQLFIDAGYVAPSYVDLFTQIRRWKLGAGGGFLVGNPDSIGLRIDLSYGDGFHLFLSTDLAAAFDGRSTRL
jgi:hypothetical protein